MAMNNQLLAVVQHIENERGVSREIVLTAIEQAAKNNLGKAEIAELVDCRNDDLRRMGIKLVQMPEVAE